MHYYYDSLNKNKAKDKNWKCANKKEQLINMHMQTLMLARSAHKVKYLCCTVFYGHWSAYNYRIGSKHLHGCIVFTKTSNTSVLMSSKENTLSHFMWLMVSDDN